MRQKYNNDYWTRGYDKFSDLEPQQEKKKPSLLTLILIGLAIVLICSFCYNNIIKPYFDKKEQQIEKPEDISISDVEEMDYPISDQTDVETTTISTDPAEQRHENSESNLTQEEDLSGLSTSELLDRMMRENLVRQAKEAGVSTEGTTSEILDRITRKNLERLNRK